VILATCTNVREDCVSERKVKKLKKKKKKFMMIFLQGEITLKAGSFYGVVKRHLKGWK
jgi:hypothetical protein